MMRDEWGMDRSGRSVTAAVNKSAETVPIQG